MAKYIVMFEGINQIEFSKQFKSNEDCFRYLADHKWGKGFVCKRCANTTWYKRENILSPQMQEMSL